MPINVFNWPETSPKAFLRKFIDIKTGWSALSTYTIHIFYSTKMLSERGIDPTKFWCIRIFTVAIISRVQAHTYTTMGRPRLYNTPEEKLSAKRVNSKIYYEKWVYLSLWDILQCGPYPLLTPRVRNKKQICRRSRRRYRKKAEEEQKQKPSKPEKSQAVDLAPPKELRYVSYLSQRNNPDSASIVKIP